MALQILGCYGATAGRIEPDPVDETKHGGRDFIPPRSSALNGCGALRCQRGIAEQGRARKKRGRRARIEPDPPGDQYGTPGGYKSTL
jgi:hypothetical protein